MVGSGNAQHSAITCGQNYTVARGDTLSQISLRAYGSAVYQAIYTANVDVIGTNPDLILIGQSFVIPCLSATHTALAGLEADLQHGIVTPDANENVPLVLTFNRASAPPFIINSGIVDGYLADITEATEGRVTFVDPEVVNRDHSQQFELVTSGAVDGAYVLNSTLADTHPELQLPMLPTFGGSAEQTAVSLWRLHAAYLAQTDYFPEAQLLGFISAPAAHIWRNADLPVTPDENIVGKNSYPVPYFFGLDTRGPAAMREEFARLSATQANEPPAYFMAHGAALAVGLWAEGSNVSVMEVDNGLYTPTFSVILSNAAWARISDQDQQAILELSGENLAFRSAAWDEFDNAFRSRMLDRGLDFEKADKALLNTLWTSSFGDLDAWIREVSAHGISGPEAVNFYLTSLGSLEDRLIYRGDVSFVDQHPFMLGRN